MLYEGAQGNSHKAFADMRRGKPVARIGNSIYEVYGVMTQDSDDIAIENDGADKTITFCMLGKASLDKGMGIFGRSRRV